MLRVSKFGSIRLICRVSYIKIREHSADILCFVYQHSGAFGCYIVFRVSKFESIRLIYRVSCIKIREHSADISCFVYQNSGALETDTLPTDIRCFYDYGQELAYQEFAKSDESKEILTKETINV